VGDTSLLTVQNGLASLFSDRFFNAGSIQALAAVGINVERDGTLSFDAQKFNNKLASDPQAVKDFFTTSQFGFVDRLKKTVDRLSSGDYAVLINRLDALNGTIADANAKIADWDKRLDAQRNLLLTRFYYMETAIGKMQNQLNVIEQIRSFQLALNSYTTTRR
jgi:flagellar hook-associated protein 2